ncbi:hypothetical protein A2U01_0105742, partial [Trifolium medium]|nr:hypothetical protein [Trifolium medium]
MEELREVCNRFGYPLWLGVQPKSVDSSGMVAAWSWSLLVVVVVLLMKMIMM